MRYSSAETGAVTVTLTGCDADEADDEHDHGGPGVSVEFDCSGEQAGRTIEVLEGGELSGNILNDGELPKANIDMMAPGAPTFKPNPNGREGGWINDAVGITSTKGKDSWITAGTSGAGVGGYAVQLRYAAAPKSGSGTTHVEAALAAAPTTALPTESKGATGDTYCVFASAVDRLGNESGLPDPEDDEGSCVEAGLERREDPNSAGDTLDATGYEALLAAAAAEEATDAATAALAEAGLLAGVDLTAPQVEFLAASVKDKATAIGATPVWGVHVADRVGTTHSDPLDVGIEVRDARQTTKFAENTADGASATADSFVVTTAGFRHTVSIVGEGGAGVRQGYYTFSATAKDAAGNKSAPVSRIALHDGTAPPAPGIFLVPSGDGYNSTIVLTEDLSIKSYSTAAVLPDIGTVTAPELVAQTGTVDAYNAASLTRSRTVEGTVNLPYKALQIDDAGLPWRSTTSRCT